MLGALLLRAVYHITSRVNERKVVFRKKAVNSRSAPLGIHKKIAATTNKKISWYIKKVPDRPAIFPEP
jgi:hypothetical protein